MGICQWCWLFFAISIHFSSSKIVHNVGDNLSEPPHVDLTQTGSSVTLYVRLCEWSIMDGATTIVNMTRYCYCTAPNVNDDSSCSVPGPTLLMHDNTTITVTVVNQLRGSEVTFPPGSNNWNKYKDMDETNLHVHGLHVSPFVDDVMVRIFPNNGSHSYPYDIGFHYPGTFWYHAHHHGSTTYQVNAGLHGAILMHQDDDDTDKYEENVLLFEWMYVVPQTLCNPDGRFCPKDGDEYTSRFIIDDAAVVVSTHGPSDDYSMCDIYCQFPPEQRNHSHYIYDVKTDLNTSSIPGSPTNFSTVDADLIFFFTNGQLNPVITLTKGKFRRLRMVNSLSNWYLQLKFPDECQWHLIATDGVYIGSAEYMNYNLSNPSHENEVIISPGGRNDIMVKCMNTGTHEIKATNNTHGDSTLQYFQRVYSGKVLFSINVIDPGTPITDGTDQLPSSYPPKPEGTYIQDLSDQTPETECPCNYPSTPPTLGSECGFEFSFSDGPSINNKPFNVSVDPISPQFDQSLTFVAMNKSYEFIINNDGNYASGTKVPHVYHQHINPFQIETKLGPNGFFALPLTWWDTMGNLPRNSTEYIHIRFWTRDYYGMIIVHCHLLQHEDHGMMGFYQIRPTLVGSEFECPWNRPVTTSAVTSTNKMELR